MEWRTLWQISASEPVFVRTKDGPIIRFSNLWDDIPGNNSASAALVDAGMVKLSRNGPNGPVSVAFLPGAVSVTLTARGRQALDSPLASPHRPRPQFEQMRTLELFDRKNPAWLQRNTGGGWFIAKDYCRQLWLLDQYGPAVPKPDAGIVRPDARAADDHGYVVPGSTESLSYLSDFVDRGFARQLDPEVVILKAGRDVLGTRPDMTAVFEAERRVHRTHKIHDGTAEEQKRHKVGANQGFYICTCGWFITYNNPHSYQWAGQHPAGGHWVQLTDTEVLNVTREREHGI